MASDDLTLECEFRRQLLAEYDAKKVNSVLMMKDEYSKLIDDLKKASEASSKSRREYYIFSR